MQQIPVNAFSNQPRRGWLFKAINPKGNEMLRKTLAALARPIPYEAPAWVYGLIVLGMISALVWAVAGLAEQIGLLFGLGV